MKISVTGTMSKDKMYASSLIDNVFREEIFKIIFENTGDRHHVYDNGRRKTCRYMMEMAIHAIYPKPNFKGGSWS